MALAVFLRGVNVGGHRVFRPAALAREMQRFDVINIGAAGTFVVRGAVTQARLRAELARRLPFETAIVICRGVEVLRFVDADPLAAEPAGPDIVRFVSILAQRREPSSPLPRQWPPTGEWVVRIAGQQGRFVLGVYRRHMRAITWLSRVERLHDVAATTRNWNTMEAVARALKGGTAPRAGGRS